MESYSLTGEKMMRTQWLRVVLVLLTSTPAVADSPFVVPPGHQDLVVDEVSPSELRGVNGRILAERLNALRDVIIRHRLVRLSSEALKTDHRHHPVVVKDGEEFEFDWCVGEAANLRLFPDAEFTIVNDRVEEFLGTHWAWSGTILGEPSSSVILVHTNDGIIKQGMIKLPETVFWLEHVGGPFHLVYERDQALEGLADEVHEVAGSKTGQDQKNHLAGTSFIDVLPTSTGGFLTLVGGSESAVTNLAILDLSYTNQVLANTGVNVSLGLAGPAFAVFTVSEWPGPSTDTLWSKINGDAHPAVTALRNNYKADLVLGYARTTAGNCGTASTITGGFGDARVGYAVIGKGLGGGCPPTSQIVAHEIGHTLGASHQWPEGPGRFADSRAWEGPPPGGGNVAMTAVGTPDICPICSVLDRYSDSNTHFGQPMVSNNRAAIEFLAPHVAGYRIFSIPTSPPHASNLKVHVECGGFAVATWMAAAGPTSKYVLKVNNLIRYIGGATSTKFAGSGTVNVKVEACIGDKCDPAPPEVSVDMNPPRCDGQDPL